MTRKVIVVSGGVNEAIEESWIYDHGWVSQYRVRRDTGNDGSYEETFQTDYTFHREDLADPIGTVDSNDPVTNIDEIERLVVTGTSETTKLTYNSNGRIQEMTLPNGHKIQWLYYTTMDDLAGPVIRNGLVKKIAHLDDGTTNVDLHPKVVYDYDAQGLIKTITDALSRTTQLSWDNGGRIKVITNDAGESTLFTYGGPTSTEAGDYLVELQYGKTASDAGRITQYRYDADGNLTSIDRQNGESGGFPTYLRTGTFVYDSDGNRVSQQDATNRIFTATYDLLRRVSTAADDLLPTPNTVQFKYDATGNRTQVTDARTKVTEFSYDALDRLVLVDQDSGGLSLITEFAYDAVGNVISVDDPKDQKTQYGYDGLSRLLSVTQPDLSSPVSYSYDGQSRLFRTANARQSPTPTRS